MHNHAKTQEKATGIWNPVFSSMFIINVLIHLSFYMMSTLSAKYADFLGAPASIVGLISSLFALTALIFRFIAGPVIDTFHRKYILLGSLFILFLSYFIFSVSKTISVIMIGRLLTGIGLAFGNTLVLTIASDSLPINKMGIGIGYFSLGTASCNAIAPTLALKLVESIGYISTFFLSTPH